MSLYLLDTDSFIFLLKHQAKIETKVNTVGYASIAIPVVTVAEVLHGAYYTANPASGLLQTRTLMAHFATIDLDTAIADRFAAIKADLRRLGQAIADFDTLIGATGIVTDRTVVTNNLAHFQRLASYGLAIENWVV